MRTLRFASLLCALAVAAAARADEDPAGTQALELEVGSAKVIPAPDGSRVLCDDGSVAAGEVTGGNFKVRGLRPGTTLCGVRQPGELPGGLYRVTVIPAKEKEKEKVKDAPPPPPRGG